MSLAAILNPIDSKEALVFYLSQKEGRQNLAVDSFSVVGGADTVYTDLNTTDGRVKPPPSDIAVTDFLGQIRVYGITKIPKLASDPEDLHSVVTQLSPTTNPVAKPTETLTQPGEHSVITVCGTGTQGFVSYFKDIDGVPNLVYYTINKNKASGKVVDLTSADYSKLSSRIVDGDPLVFYQKKGEQYIYHYNLKKDSSEKVKTTGLAERGTHIAVTLGVARPDVLFVYYRNQDKDIVRVYKSKGTWSTEKVVSNHEIDEESAIAVVAVAETVHVFFWNQGTIIHEIDDLSDDSF